MSQVSRIESAIGTLEVFVVDRKLVALGFGDGDRYLKKRFGAVEWREGESDESLRVRRYLDGDLDALAALAVDPGGTPFLARVWVELRRIPVGTTISYGELAERVGNPRAVRAVARANALNPVAIVIPCHRVIGADGTLTGYAGGLPRKQWLLEHEHCHSLQLSLTPSNSARS
jgi:methylated-DNA-[protein]-cysteine S-methyltransferase